MRIRQRKVPFPLSSLSPVPLSDPHLISPSPVVVQLNDAMPPKPATPQPQQHAFFDHQQSPIGKQTDGSDSSGSCSGFQIQELKKMQEEEEDCLKLLQKEEVEEDGADREKNNDTRKGGIFGSETSTEVVFPPSSPSNQDGRWCEGEKAIPLKKRRGSYERRVLGDDTTTENNNNNNNNKKMKTRMKTKMNKKCSTQNHNEQDYDDEEEEEEYEVVERKPEPVVGKKRARGSALMEGSRCSRVNGRGWRCCQQTLVGYSLCEHHLGKGRLRSMTSVRSRSAASSSTAPSKKEPAKPELPASSSSSTLEKQTKCDPLGNDNGEDKDEKKPLVMTTKKRMKLGIVKARSISSLLGQTNAEVTVAENNK